LLAIITDYYFLDISAKIDSGQINFINFSLPFSIYLISILVSSLFLIPALSRSIQKNEDNNSFDVKAGYDFQKKNIWKFIMVNIWGILYMLKVFLPYIIVTALIVLLSGFLNTSDVIVFTLLLLAALSMLIGVVLNITKFIVYKNIFFSKDGISARDAVKESMELGLKNNKSIWKIILAMAIVFLISEIIFQIISRALDLNIISLTLSSLLLTLFLTPYVLIISSKGYVKIREGDNNC
jgi:hypothetical protein